MTEKAPQNIPEKPHQPSSSQAIYPQGCQEPEPNEMPPLDDTISFEDGKHPLPIWARGLLLLGMIGLLVFGVVTLMQEKTTTSMNIKHLNKPQQSEISRISVTTSPAYQAKLETYGQRKAEEARRSGATYIAPIAEARQRAPSLRKKLPQHTHRWRKTQSPGLPPNRICAVLKKNRQKLPERRKSLMPNVCSSKPQRSKAALPSLTLCRKRYRFSVSPSRLPGNSMHPCQQRRPFCIPETSSMPPIFCMSPLIPQDLSWHN